MISRSASRAMGMGKLKRRQRAFQPVEMAGLVQQPSGLDAADLIDRLAQLQAAILDMHAGVPMRQVAAIDIGDAAGSGARSGHLVMCVS